MMSRILLASFIALSVGCSSGGDSGGTTTGGTTTGGTTTGGTTTGGTTTGGTTTGGTTTGGTTAGGSDVAGAWFGPTATGDAVIFVDGSANVYGLIDEPGTTYQSVFGTLAADSTGNLELFNHRDSDDPAHATSFTLAGDAPPLEDQFAQVAFSVTNDGQQLDNTGTGLPFTLAAATTSDIQTISVADLTGTWLAETSFCLTTDGCHLDLTLEIDGSGGVTGNTSFNSAPPFVADITGQIETVANSNQYVLISFVWNGSTRQGVIFQDRGSDRIVLNSFGADAGAQSNDNGNRSFSAQLTKQ